MLNLLIKYARTLMSVRCIAWVVIRFRYFPDFHRYFQIINNNIPYAFAFLFHGCFWPADGAREQLVWLNVTWKSWHVRLLERMPFKAPTILLLQLLHSDHSNQSRAEYEIWENIRINVFLKVNTKQLLINLFDWSIWCFLGIG